MKRKFPLKPLLYGIIAIILFLFTACILDPVDIDAGETETVKLRPGSLGTPGDKRITVPTNQYYIIEEFDEFDVPQSVQYVQSGGTRSTTFTDIGRLSVTAITGLDNKCSYMVTAAAAITGSIGYDEAATPPVTTSKTATATATGITLDAPASGNDLYMDISSITSLISPTGTILALKDPFPTSVGKGPTPTSGIYLLEGADTTTDYVFADTAGGVPVNLHVLRVTIRPASLPGSVTINVNFGIKDYADDITLTFTSEPTKPPRTYSQTFLLANAIDIEITGTTPPGFVPANTEWYYNGSPFTVVTPTPPTKITIDTSNSAHYNYLIAGTHTFTVIIDVGGVSYSAPFTLTVTSP